jgi:hypothetical protein
MSASAFVSSVASLWQRYYNADDSFLPFYLPLTLWAGAYVASRLFGGETFPAYHRWTVLFNLHHAGAVIFGILSLAVRDDALFNERVPILWSLSYFTVDVVDCALRADATYLFHAVLCWCLGYANYSRPILRLLRMNSKAALCEISTPLMHWSRQTRDPVIFCTFAVAFTVVRIIWVPVMFRQCLDAGMTLSFRNPLRTDPVLCGLAAFYGLNLFWYHKILRILVKNALGKDDEGSPTSRSERKNK